MICSPRRRFKTLSCNRRQVFCLRRRARAAYRDFVSSSVSVAINAPHAERTTVAAFALQSPPLHCPLPRCLTSRRVGTPVAIAIRQSSVAHPESAINRAALHLRICNQQSSVAPPESWSAPCRYESTRSPAPQGSQSCGGASVRRCSTSRPRRHRRRPPSPRTSRCWLPRDRDTSAGPRRK